MRTTILLTVVIAIILSSCASSASDSEGNVLRVTDGSSEASFSVSDLERMPRTESSFNEVTYIGVSLSTLLEEAGFIAADLSAVKASASDGYSVNYDSGLFARADVIVAFATVDGALTEDDGTFRMVLPGEEGKLNVRMLVEIKVIQ